ncbi:hypothetical protein D1B31_22775 [Neobacillus notoginsengisoli]|uniref:Cell-wall binding lipoprotein n=1 Tax=Neobacillus notoginsengisoli TaxID=1578198 RepID=A0A417YEQ7_9BACI|nr:hypothetical protein D1B31_22775 [Neobacillus notoginsengisoli]
MKKLFFLLAATVLALTGCLGQKSPEERMYEVMENAVSAEKEFEAQQNPLVDLEKKENELFDKIIGLGMKEKAQIEKLSDEALSLAAKRKDHIEKEKESIQESRNQFKEASSTLEKIKDPELKEKAVFLIKTMNERYDAHKTLYDEYKKAIEGDEDLYNSLKSEDITLEDLEKKVNSVNAHYSKVLEANEKFNKLTETYNQEKLAFYKMAGLDGDS